MTNLRRVYPDWQFSAHYFTGWHSPKFNYNLQHTVIVVIRIGLIGQTVIVVVNVVDVKDAIAVEVKGADILGGDNPATI